LGPEKGLLTDGPKKNELLGLRPRTRLTSRFEGIENVKNFDVEKWYILKVEF
jgi:hypothetical protein